MPTPSRCDADATAADGKMAWLVDFVGYSRKNSPPIRVALQTLHILQDHYPERLGRAVSFQPPFFFERESGGVRGEESSTVLLVVLGGKRGEEGR